MARHLRFFLANVAQKEKRLNLLGTTFSGGLIHVLCSSEYFWQQDGLRVHGSEATCQCNSVAH